MLQTFFSQLLAPLIVAALVSFLLQRREEAKRANRDYAVSFIDSVREDVKATSLLAVTYHAYADRANRKLHGAQISIQEADLRACLATIREDECRLNKALAGKIAKSEENFISAITGGQFGTIVIGPDDQQVSKIIAASTILRRDLRNIRLDRMEQDERDNAVATLGSVILLAIWVFIFGFFAGSAFVSASS